MKENTPKAQLTPGEQTELDRLRQENRELKQKYREVRLENRAIKTRLAYETLGHRAYKELVELAEETYDIEILKKLRSQVIIRLAECEQTPVAPPIYTTTPTNTKTYHRSPSPHPPCYDENIKTKR